MFLHDIWLSKWDSNGALTWSLGDGLRLYKR